MIRYDGIEFETVDELIEYKEKTEKPKPKASAPSVDAPTKKKPGRKPGRKKKSGKKPGSRPKVKKAKTPEKAQNTSVIGGLFKRGPGRPKKQ